MATITVPQVIPSPTEDADALMKAFQGWGTDEQAVISILAYRDAEQRKQIRLAYQEKYDESLLQRLQSELTGDFQTAMCHWVLDPVERQAAMANAATKCIHEEYPVIVEIACANSPTELLKVKQAYHALYKCSLEEDVAASAPAGNLRSLLLALVSTYRYDGEEVDGGLARSEAELIHEAVKNGENGTTDDGELIRILGTRSKAQLGATFSCFRDEHGTTLTKVVTQSGPAAWIRSHGLHARAADHGEVRLGRQQLLCEGPEERDARVSGDRRGQPDPGGGDARGEGPQGHQGRVPEDDLRCLGASHRQGDIR
ncbi:annexin-like protein RJ4 isoform X2 [Brachypodium distachyon]|uniref:annexin-like protein RJ4 isoform X2 n=1 Tax=Brachypodium distachyon TaxID=15368 RepID=UPI000D0DA3A5|nr:annexin-like protein RJ4 isoform X2 [Brachypodium distachyon]|eukprot:XP_024314775.1 annexin-like protein RJ4 isoform X2 [Brachypodium distachyon]